MKNKNLNLIFAILFIFCSISVLKAQDNNEPPPLPPKISTTKKVEAAKYYFVFQIDADSKYTLTVQSSETIGEFGKPSDKSVVTDFISALRNSDKKARSNSYVIVKTDENLNYGALTDFLQRVRVLSDHQIKIYSSKNTFESFVLIAKKPSPKDKPNPLFLLAEIKADRKVALNGNEVGNLDDLLKLTTDLSALFKDRENNGVFREGTNEVEKTVFIKAPSTMQFSEIIKLVAALKDSGAQPIELQIDDL